MYQLTEPPTLKKQEKHTIEVVVDRLTVKGSAKRRLTDSIETALRLSGGLVTLDFVDLPEDDAHRERVFSEHLYCPYDDLSFEELEPRSFSFNSPFGACPVCTGIGTTMEVDPELVVPDPGESLANGALAPWSAGQTSEYFARIVQALADTVGFRTDVPFERLPAKARTALLQGYDGQVHVRYQNRYGRNRSYYTTYEGVDPVGAAPPRRGRIRHQPRAVRGVHARGAVRGLRWRAAQAGEPGGDLRRQEHRRDRRSADR